MKKVNTTQFYKSFSVTRVIWNSRSVEVHWIQTEKNISGISMLYQHRDGTWHPDSDTASWGYPFMEALLEGIKQNILSANFTVPATEPERNGEVAKMEYLLSKEERYRKALASSKEVSVPRTHRKVLVWKAEA